LFAQRFPCYLTGVTEQGGPRKFTIWTAPASAASHPLLDQLDMRAPLTGESDARERAARAKVKREAMLRYFAPRPLAESLRKLVK
jgi:hypothetical protein